MEASRLDGVKAAQHRRTPRTDVRLDVFRVQAVAELLDAARDLVVADDLLLAVALDHVDVVVVLGDAGLVPLQGRGPAVSILSRGRVWGAWVLDLLGNVLLVCGSDRGGNVATRPRQLGPTCGRSQIF